MPYRKLDTKQKILKVIEEKLPRIKKETPHDFHWSS